MNELLHIYRRLYRAFGPQHWWPGETPFEIAVGAILTQNTNWGNVEKAIANLKTAGVLFPSGLHALSPDRLAALIRPAGYFNVKAKRLKAFIAYLMNHHRGDMDWMRRENPQTLREQLLAVHGIGPETADSILLYALEKPVFVIDAYTKRVLSRHGFMKQGRSYDDFQGLFHSSLKRDLQLFNEYHALLVKVGKEHCRPRPRCVSCPLEPFEKHRTRSGKALILPSGNN